MTRSTAMTLFETSMTVPLFHLEDVYLTGFVREEANKKLQVEASIQGNHLQHKHLEGAPGGQQVYLDNNYKFVDSPIDLTPCVYSEVVASHGLSVSQMVSIYKQLQDADLDMIDCFPVYTL